VTGLGVLALYREVIKVAGSFEGYAFEIAYLDLSDLSEQELRDTRGPAVAEERSLPCGSS
jgi:hypothetical protein